MLGLQAYLYTNDPTLLAETNVESSDLKIPMKRVKQMAS